MLISKKSKSLIESMDNPVQESVRMEACVAVAVESFGSRISGLVVPLPVQFVMEPPPPPVPLPPVPLPPVPEPTLNLYKSSDHVPEPLTRSMSM